MKPQEILREHQLRVTPCRVAVLDYFAQQPQAFTHAELEAALPDYDRITLYRTLHALNERQLLHRLTDSQGNQRFAFSGVKQKEQEHIHFQCERCLETYCLTDLHLPELPLPAGFTAHSTRFLVMGQCANCNTAAN